MGLLENPVLIGSWLNWSFRGFGARIQMSSLVEARSLLSFALVGLPRELQQLMSANSERQFCRTLTMLMMEEP